MVESSRVGYTTVMSLVLSLEDLAARLSAEDAQVVQAAANFVQDAIDMATAARVARVTCPLSERACPFTSLLDVPAFA